jgi:hypothetical protein
VKDITPWVSRNSEQKKIDVACPSRHSKKCALGTRAFAERAWGARWANHDKKGEIQ